MSVQRSLTWGRTTLRDAGIDSADIDARWIMAHVLGVVPDRLILFVHDALSAERERAFEAAIQDRCAFKPVSHIIGGRWFHGHWFRVTGAVLDPRPETEGLVDLALGAPFSTVLDLGTGSGAIVLSLLAARPDATGIGTDLSAPALEVARLNALDLGLAARAQFVQSDWFDRVTGRFDLIVSNPPYISEAEFAALAPDVARWEPRRALTPGGDGLDPYRVITARACDHLNPGGRLVVEIGHLQGPAVFEMFRAAGLDDVGVHPDMNGKDRVVSGAMPNGHSG